MKDGSKFCSACGTEVKPAPRCLKCTAEYELDAKFRSECGSVVGSDISLFGEFIDGRDGKRYRTVKMDSQIWMAENLSYSGKDGTVGKSCDNNFYRNFGVGKNDHWWCADEDSQDRGCSWYSSYSGFVSNNAHKLCLLKVRCVMG